jgi:hypothetical protein
MQLRHTIRFIEETLRVKKFKNTPGFGKQETADLAPQLRQR